MQIIGHRGAKSLAPENSLLGIRVALRENVDMIEIDLRILDDHFVLSHDPLEPTGVYTTLAEALKKTRGKVPLNLELKQQKHIHPDITARLLKEELRKYKGAYVISSYSYKLLHAVQQELPHAELAIIEKWSGIRAIAKAKALDIFRVHINQKVIWSGFVRSMNHNGYEVYAYTVNLRDRAQELDEWGVDGIFTDYPNLFNN